MTPLLRSSTVILTLVLVGAEMSGQSTPVERVRLANGVELAVFHAPSATKQAVFSFLPIGLLSDEAGHAQFAHLLEHLLIRTVDPDGLQVGDVAINGETGGSTLRLETIGPPARLGEMIARHRRWLDARTFSDATLAAEKEKIALEEQTTTETGAVGKWALAAWCQIVEHGAKHAAVHGDVAGATSAEAQGYAQRHAIIGSGLRIVVVGPAEPTTVRTLVETSFATSKETPASRPSPDSRATTRAAEAVTNATWDLPARYRMEWIRVPVATNADRAAALIAATRLAGAAFQTSGGKVQVGLDSPREGGLLLHAGIGINLPAKDQAGAERQISALAAAAAKDGVTPLQMTVKLGLRELAEPPDFPRLRQSFERQGQATPAMLDLLEANIVLGGTTQLLSAGFGLGPLPELSPDDVLARARAILTRFAAERAVLTLEPRRP